MSVGLEEDLSTTIANSTDTRAAFMKGNDLPPDEMVSLRNAALNYYKFVNKTLLVELNDCQNTLYCYYFSGHQYAESAKSLFRQLACSGSGVGRRNSTNKSGGLQTSNHLLRPNLFNVVS